MVGRSDKRAGKEINRGIRGEGVQDRIKRKIKGGKRCEEMKLEER